MLLSVTSRTPAVITSSIITIFPGLRTRIDSMQMTIIFPPLSPNINQISKNQNPCNHDPEPPHSRTPPFLLSYVIPVPAIIKTLHKMAEFLHPGSI
jgi:hypothetical protein